MVKRKDIQYRVGTFKDTGSKMFATFLIYIDSRTAMDGLDEEWGKGNWEFRWEFVEDNNWAIEGVMTTWDKDGTGVTRRDVGYPQEQKKKKGANDTEWLKDAISDALKRCAVQFGVGRELYTAPFLYTEEVKTYMDKKTGKNKLNSYDPLTSIGKGLIEGNIDKWYENLTSKTKATVK